MSWSFLPVLVLVGNVLKANRSFTEYEMVCPSPTVLLASRRKKQTTLCTLCNLVDFTAIVFKSGLIIRPRRAFWMAESTGIMFSPQNKASLLLEPENLEYRLININYRILNQIRRNLIFSGVASVVRNSLFLIGKERDSLREKGAELEK